MHALSRPRPEPPPAGAQIIPLEELNRARSLRVLALPAMTPDEALPWAYVFPRPKPGLST